jgi:hypothetical protein
MRILMMFFLFSNQVLLAQDSIGKVTALVGSAKAISETTTERALKVDSSIFVRETILVASKSKVQIQFSDGGVMNLIPNTEFKVNAYKYKQRIINDQSSGELLKGGLRTVTGSIAKKNPQGYKIRTPGGVIGVRGTIIELNTDTQTTYFGATYGKAVVENDTGEIKIGTGTEGNFASSEGYSEQLSPLVERPDELDLVNFVIPGGLNIDDVHASGALPPDLTAPDDQTPGITSPTGGGASIQGGC